MENGLKLEKEGFGLSGAVLKIIAVVTMLIDHTGAAVFEGVVLPKMGAVNGYISLYQNAYTGTVSSEVLADPNFNWMLFTFVMRQIGRIAFPIYCFLLVEGFLHTRDIKKYALRLGIFSLISELPFDLAFYGKLEFVHQNVYFTLFIGVLVMAALKKLEGRKMIQLLAIFLGMFAAELLSTDYASRGILLIVILYLLRDHKAAKCIAGAVSFSWEVTSVISFLLIPLYNGKRGKQMKYFFYAFYPVHLLLLFFLARAVNMLI